MQNLPIQLSANLSITSMCDLYTDKPETKPVIISFLFYGEECTLCLGITDSQSEWLSFSSAEGPEDLYDSFEGTLENKYWPMVTKAYNEFINSELSEYGEVVP